MNHDALMLYFSNSFSKRRVPTVPAHMPIERERQRSRPLWRSPPHTSADVTCAVLAPVASEPARDSIDVYTIALYVLVLTRSQGHGIK